MESCRSRDRNTDRQTDRQIDRHIIFLGISQCDMDGYCVRYPRDFEIYPRCITCTHWRLFLWQTGVFVQLRWVIEYHPRNELISDQQCAVCTLFYTNDASWVDGRSAAVSAVRRETSSAQQWCFLQQFWCPVLGSETAVLWQDRSQTGLGLGLGLDLILMVLVLVLSWSYSLGLILLVLFPTLYVTRRCVTW